jgi:hypothetical protein
MKRATRGRLVLLAVVGLVMVAALWQWQQDQRSDPGDLLGIDPAAVDRIGLQFQSAPMQHYSRHDGHWWTADGHPARADDGRLNELTQTAAAEVLQWRPVRDFSLSRIGLAPPTATLELNDQRVEFGETSVTGPQRYVRVGDRIALIPARYSPRPVEGKAMSLGL